MEKLDLDRLPNPHLAQFLRPDFLHLDSDTQGKEMDRAMLEASGLPKDYRELTAEGRKRARMDVLTGWYDPTKPQILCTDVNKFIKAHFLWVEVYYKPCEHNRATYYYRDPKHKYEMVRVMMSPPVVVTEPAKTVVHAPRGSTKTITLIQEACTMIAICRPNTNILIVEKNRARTNEEIKHIRSQVQNNTLIHADFGGQGELWPKNNRTGQSWNDSELTFVGPRSAIVGVSAGSSHLGRHIPLIVIDDPEDEKMYRNAELRRKYFVWLFQVVLPMLDAGGHLLWIGTPHAQNSCIQIALDGVGREHMEGGDFEGIRDARFSDWTRKKFRLVYEDDNGVRQSLFPDKLSVGAFDAKVSAIGRSAANAEFQGDPMAEGDAAFPREERKHGFMHVADSAGGGLAVRSFFYCCVTGVRLEWQQWLASLHIVSAIDPANSTDSSADYSAAITIGVDADGIIYVLDANIRRLMIDRVLREYRKMVCFWRSQRAGIEKAGTQDAVIRLASLEWERARREGRNMPPLTPMLTENKSKPERILGTLRPLHEEGKLRFMRQTNLKTSDGRTLVSMPNRNHRGYNLLLEMMDNYREGGALGHDDGPDALEQAVRLAGGRRGIRSKEEDRSDKEYEEWKEAGVEWPLASIPVGAMGPKMREEFAGQMAAAMDVEIDPYE